MSTGGKKGAAAARSRVAIPTSVKKTIDDIKEITGHNHGEDEIYAMLKDCSMDPNETAHKLLLLDAFHEVKKKRERRRENLNKEPAQLRWKQGSEVQVNRGRGNYSSRPVSHDAGGGRNSYSVKENAIHHNSEKNVGNDATLGNTRKIQSKKGSPVSSPITDISNCPSGIPSQSNNLNKVNNVWTSESINKFNKIKHSSPRKLEESLPSPSPVYSNKNMVALRNGDKQQNEMLESSDMVSLPLIYAPGSKCPSLDPLPSPTQDLPPHCELDSIKSEVESNHILAGTDVSYKESAISVGSQPESQQAHSEKATPLQRKLEELHISVNQQVVLPNHIYVPEAGKLGFSFGSFDDGFGLEMTQDGSLGSDKSPLSESSDSIGDSIEEHNPTVLVAGRNTEIKYPEHTHPHSREPEDLSSTVVEVLSSVTHDNGESKPEVTPQSHQHPIIHTSSSYNYGYVPPLLNGQIRPPENLESQARGPLPGVLMHQPFDLMSYYAQFYQLGVDSGGRSSSSPNSAGAANNSNGNVGPIAAQTYHSPQEGSAPLVMSMASPVPLLTQASGVIQRPVSSIQQHLPVLSQTTGIHIPHYPPFVPYAPYFSPIYAPPHAIHQFFSNGTFPQQPHSGNLYLKSHGTTAKYSISQNEQGSNTPNSNHVGVPVSYAAQSVPMANCSSNSVTEALNSTSNEDVKESRTHASEQQTEGTGVCQGQLAFAPTQFGQGPYTGVFHPALTVTAATCHPLVMQQSQPITIPVNMLGPTAGVYPPQQHAQLIWPSNY